MKPVASSSGAPKVPAPQVAVTSDRSHQLEWISKKLKPHTLGASADSMIDNLADGDLSILRYELEHRDDAFADWVIRAFRIGKEHCGIAMVECHDFFSACHGGASYKLSEGMHAVYEVIGENPYSRPSDFNVGNIKVAFLMKRLGIHNAPEKYASSHDYYRECELLRSNLSTVEPALPFLSVVAVALPPQPFSDAASVLEAAERFKTVDPQKFYTMFEFLSERGGVFDSELVAQLLENDTKALHDGLL